MNVQNLLVLKVYFIDTNRITLFLLAAYSSCIFITTPFICCYYDSYLFVLTLDIKKQTCTWVMKGGGGV
jgi:hypothetical protein